MWTGLVASTGMAGLTLGDDVATVRCDLDATRSYKDIVFNFARQRRPEHYRMIVERTARVSGTRIVPRLGHGGRVRASASLEAR